MTTKILSAIEEFESVRAKATPGKWSVTRMHYRDKTWNQLFSSKTKMALFPEAESSSTFAIDEDCKFIAEAANKATLFTQALKVAVEALDKYKHTDLSTESGVWGYVGSEAIAFKALAEIERILEMENDGSTIDRPISY